MKKFFLSAIVVLLLSGSVLAQTGAASGNVHFNKWYNDKAKMDVPNLDRIKASFEASWDGRSYEKGRGWKQFKRWEYAAERRTDQNGNLVNPYLHAGEYESFLSKTRPSGDSTGNWSPLGPTNWTNTQSGYNPGIGRVNAITVDPNNPQVIYAAAASGGLWKSTDAGATWTTTTDNMTILGTSDIVVDPTNSDIVYLATGDRDGLDTWGIGVLISKDGGMTWNNTGLSFTESNVDYVVNKMIHHPTKSGTVLAATKDGVFKTVDTGNSWTKVLTIEIKDLEFQPGNPDVVYACFEDFYKSTDGGNTFTQVTTGLPSFAGKMVCAVTPDDSNYVYVLAADNFNVFYGVLRSTNAADSFSTQVNSASINLLGYAQDGNDNSSQAWYDLAIAVSPYNKDEVYTGGVNVWKSMDGGMNWDISSHWYYVNDPNTYSHADIHSLDFYDSTLYCGSDGGVFVKDVLDQWSDLSGGLNIAQIYRMSNSATNPDRISTGHQDNGSNYYKSGVWSHVLGADGMETVIDPYDPDLIYCSSQNGSFSKSTDGGQTFSGVFYPDDYTDDGAWVTPFEMSATNNLNLYVACKDVYKSTNAGTTWAPISDIPNANSFTVLKVAPSDENYIYASYSRLIYATKDGGVNWEPRVLNFPTGDITDLEIDHTNPEKIYVTCAGYNDTLKVFVSEDAGESFKNISYNLPNLPANTLILDTNFSETIYVGMDLGIYYIDPNLNEWIPYQENLPNVEISELEIQYSSQKLRVATYGRGVWESPLFPTMVSVGYQELDRQIELYPNPSTGVFNLELPKDMKQINISVLNVAGVEVLKVNAPMNKKSIRLDLSNQAEGIYFVKIQSHPLEWSEKVILVR